MTTALMHHVRPVVQTKLKQDRVVSQAFDFLGASFLNTPLHGPPAPGLRRYRFRLADAAFEENG